MKTNLVVGDKVTVMAHPEEAAIPPEHGVVSAIHDDGFNYSVSGRGGNFFAYFKTENIKWARGHENRVALALIRAAKRRRALEALERKKEKAAAQRKAMQWTIDHMREAARTVVRAKLPRELRETAFQFCLMRPRG